MTKRRTACTLILLALGACAELQAATYQWRDDKGTTHFTDDAERIPAPYLQRARELPAGPAQVKSLPPAAPSPAAPAVTPAAGGDQVVKAEPADDRKNEIKAILSGLAGKRKELAGLHHRWSVARGRTPTPQELKDFEEKRAKGKATFQDNPYINKSRLSAPGRARLAYFEKLAEIRTDEERVRQLENGL